MPHTDLAYSAAVLGALACAAALLGGRRAVVLAGLALLGVAEGALAVAVVPSHDLRRLAATPVHVGALVVAAGAVAALAALLVRRPGLAPVLLLVAAPFRISLSLGSQHAMLLLPLYAVLAAAGLAYAWTLVRGAEPRPIALPLAATSTALLGLYSLSLLWAEDLHGGSIELLAFLLPFAAVLAVVARGPCPAWLPRALGITLVAEALFFAAVGLWQEGTHRVWFSRPLEVSNTYTTFFRTNSLFYDPNIYARHLVLALGILVVLLWRRRIGFWVAAGLAAVLWVGLYYSYSQSSLAALFVAVLAVTLVAGDQRARRLFAVAAVTFALVGTGLVAADVKGQSLRHLTSGRSHLVSVTLDVFKAHPVVGVGVGSQPVASARLRKSAAAAKRNASHTTPLTVAAELGLLGLAAYIAWLVGAAATLRDAWARDSTVGLALATIFGVLFVHSLSYSSFFEDPITWGVVAFAAAFAATWTPGPQPASSS
jgi:hypothetical protein